MAFLVGGIALITKTYWLFWACVAVAVLGIPAGKAVGIMDDTVEWGSSEAAQDGLPEPDGQARFTPEGGQRLPVPGETERRP